MLTCAIKDNPPPSALLLSADVSAPAFAISPQPSRGAGASITELKNALSYSPETGEFRWKINRVKKRIGSVAGAISGGGYRYIRCSGKSFSAHRLAWLFVNGEWPSAEIDHVDGNKDNNRLSNLRVATRSQNECNKPHRGYYKTRRGTFHASIKLNGERHYLGEFWSAREARAAYEMAANRLHGEFSYPGKKDCASIPLSPRSEQHDSDSQGNDSQSVNVFVPREGKIDQGRGF